MNLLDNDLVQKYFGCEISKSANVHIHEGACDSEVALKVLTAMQQPICESDLYLRLNDRYISELLKWTVPDPIDFFHGFQLRLPNKFQTEKHDKCRLEAVKPESKTEPQPHRRELLEERIFELAKNRGHYDFKGGTTLFYQELCTLVTLAREEK